MELKNQYNSNVFFYKPPSSINRLVTYGSTKLCSCGFILTPFQGTAANKIDSEHTQDYKKLFPVCEVEIF